MFENEIRKVLMPLAVVFIVVVAMGITMVDADEPQLGIRFEGEITGVAGVVTVGIQKDIGGGNWREIGTSDADSDGYYYIPGPDHTWYKDVANKNGVYALYINGEKVAEEEMSDGEWTDESWSLGLLWSSKWNTNYQNSEIPEFATIAIPSVSILGLLFFFNHRKRRKE